MVFKMFERRGKKEAQDALLSFQIISQPYFTVACTKAFDEGSKKLFVFLFLTNKYK